MTAESATGRICLDVILFSERGRYGCSDMYIPTLLQKITGN